MNTWNKSKKVEDDTMPQLIAALQRQGNLVFVLDHKYHNSDLLVLSTKTNRRSEVEVKAHQNTNKYPTFPLEVFKGESDTHSNWLTNPTLDLFINIDTVSGLAHVFNGPELQAWCWNQVTLKMPLKTFKGSDQGARGFLVPWTSKNAGYQGQIKLCMTTDEAVKILAAHNIDFVNDPAFAITVGTYLTMGYQIDAAYSLAYHKLHMIIDINNNEGETE